MATVARFVFPQSPLLLKTRPFAPPIRFSVTLLTGASGTDSKVVRSRPLTLSMRAARTIRTCPFKSSTMSGSRWAGLERR